MAIKNYYIADLEFVCLEDPITVADGKCKIKAPYDGEILSNIGGAVATGHILDAGAGAGGSTTIQIHNETQGRDYFDTKPAFREADKDANGRATMRSGTLLTRPSFRAGDTLRLDVDGVSTGPGFLTVWLTCGFWREVT